VWSKVRGGHHQIEAGSIERSGAAGGEQILVALALARFQIETVRARLTGIDNMNLAISRSFELALR